MTKAAELAKMGEVLTNSQIGGRRNILINGDFKIWQRATSSTAANYSGPDRWYYGNAGTYSRSTDVPSGEGFQYSNSVKVTAATSYGVTAQRIEAVNCKHLVGKTVTASFWLKTISGSTGMYCVLYRANTEDGHSSGVTAIETKAFTGVTGTWTYYTLTWSSLPSETANGLQLYFYSADASTDPEYRITGIQLEVGSQATPFEHRSYGEELALCQRYYSKYTDSGSYMAFPFCGFAGTSSLGEMVGPLPATMRVSPTASVNGGSNFRILMQASDQNTTAVSIDFTSLNACRLSITASGMTAGQAIGLINKANTFAEITFDSEL